jgi:hypothetical protein
MRDQRGEPNGAEAWEILSRALKRRNEARYCIITPIAAPVFADAIDRIAAAVRATDALLELRPHLPR